MAQMFNMRYMRRTLVAAVALLIASVGQMHGIRAACPADSYAKAGASNRENVGPVVAGKEKKKEKTVNIYGSVYDSFTKGKLKAFVTLMRADSTVVDTVTCYTTEQANFSYYAFKVPRGDAMYILKAVAEGYHDSYSNFELKNVGRKVYVDIPEILMKRRAGGMTAGDVNLQELVVKGTRVQIAYRGDTIVYDAAAFNLPEGSMLDGLIRQLPGAELKDNGDIYINGEKIDYLTLNGKDFFRGDNKVMLDNLPYYTVKEVKAYHKSTEKSEMLGREVEQKDFVLDVNLKREFARSYIANAEAGGGTAERWMARMFGLYYNDQTRVSVFGNMNNVNENRTPGSDGEWQPSNMPRGLLTAKQVGMNVQTEDKDKNYREGFDVKLTWEDARNEQRTSVEKFATGGSIYSGTESVSSADKFVLNIHNSLSLKKPSLFLWSHLYYTDDSSASVYSDSTYSTSLINRNLSLGQNRIRSFSIHQLVSWYKTLGSGDDVSFDMQGSYNVYKPYEAFSRQRTFYASTGETDTRDFYNDKHTDNYFYLVSAVYSYNLINGMRLSPRISYRQETKNNRNQQYRLDRLGAEGYDEYGDLGWLPSTRGALQTALDSDNSSTAFDMNREWSASVSLNWYTDKINMSARVPVSIAHERIHYSQAVLDTTARRSDVLWQPSFFLRIVGKTQFSFQYNMQMSKPDFASLMPVGNNSNPL